MLKKLPRVIVYTRHPQCRHNVDHFREIERGVQNRDSELTALGKEQCTRTAEFLKSEYGAFDAVYCSEYRRTRALPEAMGLGHLVEERSDLNEWNMGIWQMMPKNQVCILHPEETERFVLEGHPKYRALYGESILDVDKRLRRLLKNEFATLNDERVYISGHGAVLLCLRRILCGHTWARWRESTVKERPPNASVTVFERRMNETRFKCTLLNYVPWIRELGEGVTDS